MHRYLREPVSAITHFIGAILALIGLIWLVVMTYPDIDRIIISLVYGMSVTLTFTASTIMHTYVGSEKIIRLLNRFDHAAIYLMIAGTYTPFAYIFLDSVWFIGIMVAIWGMAIVGVIWKLFFYKNVDNLLSLLYYLGMGWFSLILIPHLFRLVDVVGFVLIVSGGLMFTVGAIIFGMQRPNFNRWWGHHEIWHLFVLAGAALHFGSVVYYLV